MKNKQQLKIERPKEQKIIYRVYQEPKIRNKEIKNIKKNNWYFKKSPHTFSYVCKCVWYVCIMVYVSACRDGAKGGLKAKLRIIETKKWSFD